MTGNDGNPYPDGTEVRVRYPATGPRSGATRAAWPYLPGVVEQRCGHDEWQVALTDRRAAVLDDGTAAPEGTPDEDLCFPTCFRDRSEIRQRPSSGQ